MSFSFTGASTSYLRRQTGNVSNTNNFTCSFWAKRTANFSGVKALWAVVPADDSTGHGLYCNAPGDAAYGLDLQVNFASQQAKADPLALNTWTFFAIVGAGSNISLKFWDGSAIITETVAQSAFAVGSVRLGDFGGNAHLFTGLMAHVRWWNAGLSDVQLVAEKNSATAVLTTNLVSAHSGGGGSLSAALSGETGGAYIDMGAVAYSSDAPTFDTFSGAVISGESTMPHEVVAIEGERVNRLLHSGDLTQAVYAKQGNTIVGGAASAPAGYGTSQRVQMNVSTGGVYQRVSGIPDGWKLAYRLFRRVDADYVCFRHMNGAFSAGQQGIFSLVTGQWAYTGAFGGATGGSFISRSLGSGWYLVGVAALLSGDRAIEFYPTIAVEQTPANGRRIDTAAGQLEDVVGSTVLATYYKPTTSAPVARSLASVAVSLNVTSIGVGQQAIVTAQLLDDAGAPWDQFGPVLFESSDETKATVANDDSKTDFSGRISAPVTGVALGSTTLTAEAGAFTSSGTALTVAGASIIRWVRIITEGGWEGTSGWHVGVWRKHPVDRFPTTKLFEVPAQKFANLPYIGHDWSYMDVAVPSYVSVSVGEVVEVAIENDNVGGRPYDGPGIFSATVISG